MLEESMQKCQDRDSIKQLLCPELQEKPKCLELLESRAPIYETGRAHIHDTSSKRRKGGTATGSIEVLSCIFAFPFLCAILIKFKKTS